VQATQNALGYVTTPVYDAAGRQIASVNARGSRSTSVYDAHGALLST